MAWSRLSQAVAAHILPPGGCACRACMCMCLLACLSGPFSRLLACQAQPGRSPGYCCWWLLHIIIGKARRNCAAGLHACSAWKIATQTEAYGILQLTQPRLSRLHQVTKPAAWPAHVRYAVLCKRYRWLGNARKCYQSQQAPKLTAQRGDATKRTAIHGGFHCADIRKSAGAHLGTHTH